MKKSLSNIIGGKRFLLSFVILVVVIGAVGFVDGSKQYIHFNNSINNSNLYKSLTTEDLKKVEKVYSSFSGIMTAYGYDCVGCSGYVGCAPYQWVGDNNIYYEDKEYGKLRIVAADRSIPCGSIMKIDSPKHEDTIYAVVLDRGGGIGFDKFVQIDLLMGSEEETLPHGLARNTKAEILRYGWNK